MTRNEEINAFIFNANWQKLSVAAVLATFPDFKSFYIPKQNKLIDSVSKKRK